MCASKQFEQLTPQYSHRFKLQFEQSEWIIDSLSQLVQLVLLSSLSALPFIKTTLPSPSNRMVLSLSLLSMERWLLFELFLAPLENRRRKMKWKCSKKKPVVSFTLEQQTHRLICNDTTKEFSFRLCEILVFSFYRIYLPKMFFMYFSSKESTIRWLTKYFDWERKSVSAERLRLRLIEFMMDILIQIQLAIFIHSKRRDEENFSNFLLMENIQKPRVSSVRSKFRFCILFRNCTVTVMSIEFCFHLMENTENTLKIHHTCHIYNILTTFS